MVRKVYFKKGKTLGADFFWVKKLIYRVLCNPFFKLSIYEETCLFKALGFYYLQVEGNLKKAWKYLLKGVSYDIGISATGMYDIALQKRSKELAVFCGKAAASNCPCVYCPRRTAHSTGREQFLRYYYEQALDLPIFDVWEVIDEKKKKRSLLNMAALRECNDLLCKRKDRLLRMCKRCEGVFYCSKKHQKRDWIAKHKDECFRANSFRKA